MNSKLSSSRALAWLVWPVLMSGFLDGCSSGHAKGDAGTAKLGTTPNVIVNGDAEAGPGASSGSMVVASVPGWTTSGNANVVMYGAHSGYPTQADRGPPDRGANFFAGGPDDPSSVFTQHIDLGAYTAFIGHGNVSFKLSAYLGGYAEQEDNAVLTVTFLGAAQGSGGKGATLSTATLGPVRVADRDENTGLLARATVGAVPAKAASADVQLTMTRTEGSNNDGYADDLILILSDAQPSADAGADPDAASPDAADTHADASTTDGSGTGKPDGGSISPTVAEVVRNGGMLDFDGDGRVDVIVTVTATTWNLRMPGKTTDYYDITYTGPDDYTAMGDLGGNDGLIDLNQSNQRVGDVVTYTSSSDTDYDGVFDLREQRTTDLAASTTHDVIQKLDAGGTWQTLSDLSWPSVEDIACQNGNLTRSDRPNCNGAAGSNDQPSSSPSTSSPLEPNIQILTGSGGGCSLDQARDILSALDSIFDPSNLGRLSNVNPEAGAKLMGQIGGVPIAPIQISCGLHCNAWVGISDAKSNPRTINLDADWLFASSDRDFLKETLTHELLHVAGFGPAHKVGGPLDPTDLVNSCARFTTNTSSDYNRTSHLDCELCKGLGLDVTGNDPCQPPCPKCTQWNDMTCQCEPMTSDPMCRTQMIFCNCNQQCYTSGADCTSNCHDSLACFFAICAPAMPGQCGP
jgi:hypothetical protein